MSPAVYQWAVRHGVTMAALQELAIFAAGSWSNLAIVDHIEAVRALRKAEIAEAAAEAKHAAAMRAEVCAFLGITPGAFIHSKVANGEIRSS